MKRSTRILAIVGAVVALVVVLLLVLPFLFRGTIAARVKTAVNGSVNARVDWRNVGLSFFRDFPNLTVTLDDLTAVGVRPFEADTLAAVRHLRVSVNLASALGTALGSSKPIVIRTVQLDHPRLRLIRLEDGAANWDITKKTTETATPAAASKPMAISLKRFEIMDGAVTLDDRHGKFNASVLGYDHSLSGDFSQTLVAVRSKADADTVSVTFAGVPYLNRVRLALNTDAQADLAKKIYTLKTSELQLNDLKLSVTGSASTAGKNIGLDLAFNAPSTNFRSILSLVPAVYAHDFDKVQTSGTFAVNGKVKGEYGDSAFPSFALNAKVNDAAFKYPDLPLPARSIFMDLALTNPGGSADSTLVKLDRFHLLLGSNPVDARMMMRTPVSDPDVDLRVKGKVDLADVRRTVKLEGIDQLTGTVAADAAVRTRMSYVDKKQYDKVNASGSVDVGGLTVKGKTLPHPLSIQQASLTLAPQHAQLKSFAGTIGSSDLQASGTLENLLSYAFRDDTLRGTATVRSNKFNLDEWKSGESDLQVIPVPPKIDFSLGVTVAQLTYGNLVMNNARGRLRLKDQRVTLEDFEMNTLGGQIGVTGYYETTNLAKPTFDLGFKMTKVDIPSAFKAFNTVQMLAPVAKYAIGKVTTDFRLNGALGKDMMPLFPGLTGAGKLADLAGGAAELPADGQGRGRDQAQLPRQPDPERHQGGLQDPGRPLERGPVRRQARADDDERLRLQRPRSVAAVRPQAAGSALTARRRREPGPRRCDVAGRQGGRRPERGVRDSARHPARRHGDQSQRQGRCREPHLVGDAGRGAGGHEEAVRRGDAAAGAGGPAGRGHPAAGRYAGEQGEAGGIQAG